MDKPDQYKPLEKIVVEKPKKEDDLVIGKKPEESEAEEEDGDYNDYVETREDIAGIAYYAISACSEFNPMTEEETKRVRRVKRKALRIMEFYINAIYKELFFSQDQKDKEQDENES